MCEKTLNQENFHFTYASHQRKMKSAGKLQHLAHPIEPSNFGSNAVVSAIRLACGALAE